jgi:hypothetical protein
VLIDHGARSTALPLHEQQSTALTACDPTKTTADERNGLNQQVPSLQGQGSLRGNQQISPISIRSGQGSVQSSRELALALLAEFLPGGNRGLPQRQVQGVCRESPTVGADQGRSTKTVQERQADHADPEQAVTPALTISADP